MTEDFDGSWGWNGPIGEMLKSAVCAGAYWDAAREGGAQIQTFERLGRGHSARAATLADGVGVAGLLLSSAGLTVTPA